MIDAARRYAELYSEPDGRVTATFQILYLAGWAPHESQQKPMKPGTAQVRLADALKVEERSVPLGDTNGTVRKERSAGRFG